MVNPASILNSTAQSVNSQVGDSAKITENEKIRSEVLKSLEPSMKHLSEAMAKQFAISLDLIKSEKSRLDLIKEQKENTKKMEDALDTARVKFSGFFSSVANLAREVNHEVVKQNKNIAELSGAWGNLTKNLNSNMNTVRQSYFATMEGMAKNTAMTYDEIENLYKKYKDAGVDYSKTRTAMSKDMQLLIGTQMMKSEDIIQMQTTAITEMGVSARESSDSISRMVASVGALNDKLATYSKNGTNVNITSAQMGREIIGLQQQFKYLSADLTHIPGALGAFAAAAEKYRGTGDRGMTGLLAMQTGTQMLGSMSNMPTEQKIFHGMMSGMGSGLAAGEQFRLTQQQDPGKALQLVMKNIAKMSGRSLVSDKEFQSAGRGTALEESLAQTRAVQRQLLQQQFGLGEEQTNQVMNLQAGGAFDQIAKDLISQEKDGTAKLTQALKDSSTHIITNLTTMDQHQSNLAKMSMGYLNAMVPNTALIAGATQKTAEAANVILKLLEAQAAIKAISEGFGWTGGGGGEGGGEGRGGWVGRAGRKVASAGRGVAGATRKGLGALGRVGSSAMGFGKGAARHLGPLGIALTVAEFGGRLGAGESMGEAGKGMLEGVAIDNSGLGMLIDTEEINKYGEQQRSLKDNISALSAMGDPSDDFAKNFDLASKGLPLIAEIMKGQKSFSIDTLQAILRYANSELTKYLPLIQATQKQTLERMSLSDLQDIKGKLDNVISSLEEQLKSIATNTPLKFRDGALKQLQNISNIFKQLREVIQQTIKNKQKTSSLTPTSKDLSIIGQFNKIRTQKNRRSEDGLVTNEQFKDAQERGAHFGRFGTTSKMSNAIMNDYQDQSKKITDLLLSNGVPQKDISKALGTILGKESEEEQNNALMQVIRQASKSDISAGISTEKMGALIGPNSSTSSNPGSADRDKSLEGKLHVNLNSRFLDFVIEKIDERLEIATSSGRIAYGPTAIPGSR